MTWLNIPKYSGYVSKSSFLVKFAKSSLSFAFLTFFLLLFLIGIFLWTHSEFLAGFIGLS